MTAAAIRAPRVPWAPEPTDALHARYPAALEPLVDPQAVARGEAPAPSGEPRHVFDSQLGLRLIISRERLHTGAIGIHVSASWHRPVPPTSNIDSLRAEIQATWEAVSGSSLKLMLIGFSGGAVPHFLVETVQ